MFDKPKPPKTTSGPPFNEPSGTPFIASTGVYPQLQPKPMKSRSHFVKNFFFGFATATSIIFATALTFVLFCPLWQEWRHPEAPVPQIHVKTTVEAPQVYMMPIRTHVINRGNERPSNAAPKMKKP